MKSRWSHDDAAAFDGPIGGCVYCSRLIGSDPSLVLHGGGNSSVKASYVDITGRPLDSIYVKGSGKDMGSIDAAGFAALRLDRLRELLDLDVLSDADMARELNAARLDPGPTRARRRARVDERRHPGERCPPRRGVRHGTLGRRRREP
jgi:rhamnose utilization protein RhaD (predicted bifunctional aldolase and dehydrogenase)